MKRYKVFSFWEYLLLVCFLLLSGAFFYFSYQNLNYKAYRLLKNKKIEEAQIYFKQAVEKDPSQLVNYLNLALSYDLSRQSKKTEEIYDRAVSRFLDKDIHSFFLYFNKAEFYSRLKSHPEKALQAYQKALEFNYKKDLVKKNIEWLFKDEKAPEDPSDDAKEGGKSKQNNEEESDRESKGEKGKEKQGDLENQSQNKRSKKEGFEDKSKDSGESQTDKKEESQREDNQKDQSEKEDRNGEGDKKNQEESQDGGGKGDQGENQDGGGKGDQGENQDGGVGSNQEEEEKLSEEESLSKSFDFGRSEDIDEKAILEEIQKQESQARSRFYKGKRTFGDKTDKNW